MKQIALVGMGPLKSLSWDEEANRWYLKMHSDSGISRSTDILEGLNVDRNRDGSVYGIEGSG